MVLVGDEVDDDGEEDEKSSEHTSINAEVVSTSDAKRARTK
jgi:hypothetical protein